MSAVRKAGRVLRLLVFALAAGALPALADDLALRVVLLANADDPDSLRVAQHYASARGVPADNIVALPMSRAETIGWSEFVNTLWEPLQARLVQRGWIDGVQMNLADDVGRTKYAISGHRIAYLVVCRGVPLRIAHSPELYAPVAPYTENPIFRTNAGGVDAELSLLAKPIYAINAFVSNPLFNDDRPSPFDLAKVIKVSRLDGPTPEAALKLVDRAIEAERTGLLGRAYVDIGGVHRDGERWLEAVAGQLGELGFDVDVDRSRQTFAGTVRFDAPVLYFGWYTGKLGGPFALPDFQFPPGAIALHIHSFSAQTLRSATAHWCGPLVARGVTATVGNVFEPYLQLTHRPDLLLRALARGDNWGDAVAYALPALSWQTVAIGDPLYRPFARSFEEQWKNRRSLPLRLGGYATLRQMRQLEAAGQAEEALALARTAQRETPTFAVGLALAQRLQAAGDLRAAASALGFVPLLENHRT
ncbi:MAG TPA: TIGR03790 family protein, partial [Opitutus sp.]|nr:TIGR03790 family protein [Opitutus sp.]